MFLKLKLIFLLLFVLSLSACTDSRENKMLEKFEQSNYSFTQFQAVSYHGIDFKIPKEFTAFTYDDLFLNKGKAWHIPELGLFFTVEELKRSDFEEDLQNNDDEEIRPVDVAHSYFFEKRAASVVNLDYSNYLRGENPHYETTTNHMIGKKPYGDLDLHYDLLTLEKGKKFFVFQLISNEDLSKYVLDDFNKIINSVR